MEGYRAEIPQFDAIEVALDRVELEEDVLRSEH
jgi:hypothetical protein